jgi:predicted aspartyl protease
MGVVRAEVTLSNPRRPEVSPLKVKALVDTGALHFFLPEHVRLQLGLEERERGYGSGGGASGEAEA